MAVVRVCVLAVCDRDVSQNPHIYQINLDNLCRFNGKAGDLEAETNTKAINNQPVIGIRKISLWNDINSYI